MGLAWEELSEGGFPELCDPFCDAACDADEIATADNSTIIAVRSIAYRFSKQVSLGSGRYLTSMGSARQLLYECSGALSSEVRRW